MGEGLGIVMQASLVLDRIGIYCAQAMYMTLKDKLGYLGLSVFILLFDQISKWAVMEHMIRPALPEERFGVSQGFFTWIIKAGDRLPYVELPQLPFFNIVMVWNKGISFGMFTQSGDLGVWLLVGLSVIVTIWFTAWLFWTHNRFQSLCIALVIGGAIGNAVDRLRFKAVIDFLDFHAFGWHYPAFNIGDSAIVIGIFMLMFYALFLEKRFHSEPGF